MQFRLISYAWLKHTEAGQRIRFRRSKSNMANKIYHEEPLQRLHPVITYSIHLQIIFSARTATPNPQGSFYFCPAVHKQTIIIFSLGFRFWKTCACQPPALLSIDIQTRWLEACHTRRSMSKTKICVIVNVPLSAFHFGSLDLPRHLHPGVL